MEPVSAFLEFISVAKGMKEVGKMAEELGGAGADQQKNGHRNHNGHGNGSLPKMKTVWKAPTNGKASQGEIFSDVYEESPRSRRNSSIRAPACYSAVLENMAELTRLKGQVDYHARVSESTMLQVAEGAKSAFHQITSHGPLRMLKGMVGEPVLPLEAIVGREIEVMKALQAQADFAAYYSEGIVTTLKRYDKTLMGEFGEAKSQLLENEGKLSKIDKATATISEQLQQMPMDDVNYVPTQMKLNNVMRAKAETKNVLEMTGQRVVDTYKQSSQVRAKEDVVRMGLHELRLVNSYVTRFLTFAQQTRQADALLPQLVETATAVTEAYQVLTGIVQSGNTATTQAVERLAQVIGAVDYTVMPNVQKEVNKQRAVLDRADKKTSFYEQAVKLLRGNYNPARAAEKTEAAPIISPN